MASNCRLLEVKTSDGKTVKADIRALRKSKVIDAMITSLGYDVDDGKNKHPITVGGVDEKTLNLVLEWCDHHKEEGDMPAIIPHNQQGKYILPDWDVEFLENMSMPEAMQVTFAAKTLDIPQLLDYLCKMNSNMGVGESTEGLSKLF